MDVHIWRNKQSAEFTQRFWHSFAVLSNTSSADKLHELTQKIFLLIYKSDKYSRTIKSI